MFRASNFPRLSAMAIAVAGLISTCAAGEPADSKLPAAQPVSVEQPKFTYYYFWRENSAPAKEGLRALKTSLSTHSEKASYVTVNVNDPEQRELVEKFKVGRSPMPLVLAVAPNGAVTGASTNGVNPEWVSQTLVTPRMTQCMKSMQSGKLVVLCVYGSDKRETPPGVRDFVADPHFQQRTAVHSLDTTDPAEQRFLRELQIPTEASDVTTVVMMAPPGVLVGKFPGNVSGQQMAAKLHAQGKCCNDPNCKHNRGGN